MTQAEQIYHRHKLGTPGAFETVDDADLAILAAINEALQVNATRLAELEEENRKLMEGKSRPVASEQIIPMQQPSSTDEELVDKLGAENRKLRRLINKANSIIRSCKSVADRKGDSTNWEPLSKAIEKALQEQAEYFDVKLFFASRPVESLEWYLDGKEMYADECGHDMIVRFNDALAALQALKEDKEKEVQEWFDIAHNEMNKVDSLTAEVERLKTEVDFIIKSRNDWSTKAIDAGKNSQKLTTEVERLKGVLGDLVELKRWKYKHGADEAYLKNRDAVWIRAFELIPEPPKQ